MRRFIGWLSCLFGFHNLRYVVVYKGIRVLECVRCKDCPYHTR